MGSQVLQTVLRVAAALVLLSLFHLAAQHEGAVKEVAIGRDFSWQPVPQWSNGHLLGWQEGPQVAPPVYAYDREGHKLFEKGVGLADADQIDLRDAAASREGIFAVAGIAFKSNLPTGFAAWLDRAGEITRVLQLGDFAPSRLCFDKNGLLWIAGRVVTQRQRDEPEHDILRVYDSAGQLKFSALPKSSFGLSRRGWSDHPVMYSDLTANDHRIVFLSDRHQQIVLLSLDGKIVSHKEFAAPASDYMATGFAITRNGDIYSGCQIRLGKSSGEVAIFKWDEATSAWVKVRSNRGANADTNYRGLYGADGEHLVIQSKNRSFRWVLPAAQ